MVKEWMEQKRTLSMATGTIMAVCLGSSGKGVPGGTSVITYIGEKVS